MLIAAPIGIHNVVEIHHSHKKKRKMLTVVCCSFSTLCFIILELIPLFCVSFEN
jgi:hypothetical protein